MKAALESQKLAIISNQGAFGGGEVMLMAVAEAMRGLGFNVSIVAPQAPATVADAAEKAGFNVIRIPSRTTAHYLAGIRRWSRASREGLLWCNGLRPAFATAGRNKRVVHLHQLPEGSRREMATLARLGANLTVVPSHYLADRLPGSVPMWNWVRPCATQPATRKRSFPLVSASSSRPVTLGYLGRLTTHKGVAVLCEAIEKLVADGMDVELELAGEANFNSDADAQLVNEAVARLGSRARVRGWVDGPQFFDEVDLAVFPSVQAESFGLVVAEAMGNKCPFVISDAGALPEVAGAGYPFVASAGDAQALADSIRAALTSDRWDDQVETSYQRWSAHFTPEAGTARLVSALQTLGWTGGSDR